MRGAPAAPLDIATRTPRDRCDAVDLGRVGLGDDRDLQLASGGFGLHPAHSGGGV
jgi:hypothetical protein